MALVLLIPLLLLVLYFLILVLFFLRFLFLNFIIFWLVFLLLYFALFNRLMLLLLVLNLESSTLSASFEELLRLSLSLLELPIPTESPTNASPAPYLTSRRRPRSCRAPTAVARAGGDVRACGSPFPPPPSSATRACALRGLKQQTGKWCRFSVSFGQERRQIIF